MRFCLFSYFVYFGPFAAILIPSNRSAAFIGLDCSNSQLSYLQNRDKSFTIVYEINPYSDRFGYSLKRPCKLAHFKTYAAQRSAAIIKTLKSGVTET